ncbi:MAG: N-acetyl-gamma-glutamyl-phosphate reductase, partial [Moorella sp. (in: Bacteria)]|nr:N-acetyl-gamma-glutamyl-phosphate reductase [Moorella sp. (in: firmicutes)]
MVKVGIIGATGYTGAELVRILSRHPYVELEALTSRTYAGEDIAAVYPALSGYAAVTCAGLSPEEVLERVEAVFVALPHGHAVPVTARALAQGVRVIDLGADLRFRQAKIYEEWYKV